MAAQRLRMSRPQEVDGSNMQEDALVEADEIDRMLSSLVVKDALQALTPAHRAVLRETYFAGKPALEAAKALGIPVGTVKSRLHYALRSLKLALEERGVTTVELPMTTGRPPR